MTVNGCKSFLNVASFSLEKKAQEALSILESRLEKRLCPHVKSSYQMSKLIFYLLITLILCSLLAWGLTPVVLEGQEVFEDALSFMTTVIKSPAEMKKSHYFAPIFRSHPARHNRDIYLLDESFLI